MARSQPPALARDAAERTRSGRVDAACDADLLAGNRRRSHVADWQELKVAILSSRLPRRQGRADPFTRGVRVFTALCVAASFASLVPSMAGGSGGNIEKLNAPLVNYRTSGIAYVRDANGRYSEQPLVTAALGAGDRIRYLIVATNSTKVPQLAGVAVTIPEYTIWDPSAELEGADIVQWTDDRLHWHSGVPGAAETQRVKVVRWVLADKLRAGLSTAFVFQLRLTGPFSDRTGDLNMARAADVKPVETLNDAQISEIQREAHVEPEIADPLGLSALYADKSKLLHFNGQLQAEIAMRNDVAYRVTGTAYVHDDHGIVSEVPLSQARLHAGDRVRFVFSAQNTGDAPRQAGSTFTIPAYARFDSAAAPEGVVDLSADGEIWRSNANRGKLQPRYVRWTHAGRLAPGEASQFSVMLTVVREPSPAEFTAKSGQGSFDPLSASAIQSVLFTHDLTVGRQQSYGGVPITEQIVRGVKALALPALPGFVASGAAPIPEHEPVDSERTRQLGLFGSIGFGALALVGLVILFLRRGGGGRNWTPDSYGRRGRGGIEGTIIGSSSDLEDRQWTSQRGAGRAETGRITDDPDR
jgi:hypothetical protein